MPASPTRLTVAHQLAHGPDSGPDAASAGGGSKPAVAPLFCDEERAAAGQIVRDAIRATRVGRKVVADAAGMTDRAFEKALEGEKSLSFHRLVRIARNPATAAVARVVAAQLNTLADAATLPRGLSQSEHVVVAIREVGEWAAKVAAGESGPVIEKELLDVIDACNRAVADLRAAKGVR